MITAILILIFIFFCVGDKSIAQEAGEAKKIPPLTKEEAEYYYKSDYYNNKQTDKQMTTRELTNREIALFMGMETITNNVCMLRNANGDKISVRRLTYDRSWDSLVPVINKIITLHDTGRYGIYNSLLDIIKDALTDLSIRGTYDAVFEWIKEYNANQIHNN